MPIILGQLASCSGGLCITELFWGECLVSGPICWCSFGTKRLGSWGIGNWSILQSSLSLILWLRIYQLVCNKFLENFSNSWIKRQHLNHYGNYRYKLGAILQGIINAKHWQTCLGQKFSFLKLSWYEEPLCHEGHRIQKQWQKQQSPSNQRRPFANFSTSHAATFSKFSLCLRSTSSTWPSSSNSHPAPVSRYRGLFWSRSSIWVISFNSIFVFFAFYPDTFPRYWINFVIPFHVPGTGRCVYVELSTKYPPLYSNMPPLTWPWSSGQYFYRFSDLFSMPHIRCFAMTFLLPRRGASFGAPFSVHPLVWQRRW